MSPTLLLKQEMNTPPEGIYSANYYSYLGYRKNMAASNLEARTNAIVSLFTQPEPYIYDNDLIVGSIRPLWCEKSEEELRYADSVVNSYGSRDFITNIDHFSPDYRRLVKSGIPGILAKIAESEKTHKNDREKLEYLDSMGRCVTAFAQMIENYGKEALKKSKLASSEEQRQAMELIANNCNAIVSNPPATFAQGLQLVWFCHTAFNYEGRGANALGRIDQYLRELFENDMKAGTVTHSYAVLLLENVFMKIYEKRAYLGFDDVVNICIGGSNRKGESDVNELSYCVLEAVRNCNVPGPNLSARISESAPDEFLDACLKVIGTGLGYPALMNDGVNIKALERMGYEKEDIYDYSFVGCVENFITGMQPPWSDGRFDTPRFFEYVFNRGKGIVHPSRGIDTGDVSEITDMNDFMSRLEKQLEYGADEYYMFFANDNNRLNPKSYRQPFISCFCRDCIGRGLDICEGGAKYPSVHGAGLMGVGTVSDSLAAIEQVVFIDREATLSDIEKAIKANFDGYEELRKKLLAAPKYGNNNDLADKYAVWFVSYLSSLFDRYRTHDGGRVYVAIAANTANISAGKILAATPDGRKAGEPLSDAASPTYGRDTRGVTSTVNSISKPDYSLVACGTVINQKFSPSMFEDGKRQKLLTLIKTYFKQGGQEMQINATSRQVLIDAMEHPENYGNLVVRVSGFSAFYVTLIKDVQLDILNRTQQG